MIRDVGGKGVVIAIRQDGVDRIGQFEWGDAKKQSCAELARAILIHLLDDQARADRLYRRFMYRTVAIWPAIKSWTHSDEEFLTVVDEIERVEKETTGLRERMARERPMIQVDGPPAGGAWGSSPPIIRNKPPERG